MVDYTRDIGGNTSLMIRDTGGNVEFWIRTGSSTWNNEQPWSFRANNSESGTRYFRLLRGGAWQKMGEVHVGYDQDIRFSVYNSGIGFPTHDFWQHITRSTVPGPPNIHQTYATSSSNIHVEFTGGYDGGSPVLEWQLAFGNNSNYPEQFIWSNGVSDVGSLSSGQRVYFWARGRNAIGWGLWSNRTEATTWKPPNPPGVILFPDVDQKSVTMTFNAGSSGGTPILEHQIGYGKDPNGYSFAIPVQENAFNILSNLDPGKLYYFWVRSRNAVGWGPWSERRQVTLIAGARIFVGTQWVRAVPYVRINGTWKVVRPWVRSAGVWKETSL